MKQVPVTVIAVARPLEKSWVAVLSDLVKARLTSLVLASTAVGFYIGSAGETDFGLMFHALLGTALLASGASALNQLFERDYDRRMRRTQDRPLPSGRMSPEPVLRLGAACAVSGLVYLAVAVNFMTALAGIISLGIYLFVYTPLKRITAFNTVVGAVPGALPPLMGWVAAGGGISAGAWVLFAIQFFWQLPHFLAIAWMYRDEYAEAGFVMLPTIDPEGHRTGFCAVSHTLALVPVSLCPVLLHLAGPVYLTGAWLLGLMFVWCAAQFARQRTNSSARRLFCASILYLPLLFGLLVMDKTCG